MLQGAMVVHNIATNHVEGSVIEEIHTLHEELLRQ